MTATVTVEELRRRQDAIDRYLVAEGAGHVVHDLPIRADGRAVSLQSRPWRLDPIPYVLERSEFDWLEAAVAERMRAAEAILGDLYGPRRLVSERVVPPQVLWSTPRYRQSAIGARPVRWLTTYALDVVRDTAGRWHAVGELTDAPAGLGYALLNRTVMNRLDRSLDDRIARSLRPWLATLRRALADTSSVEGPRIVTFTGGIDHPSYIEHSYLATQLGFNLVEGADLVVRQRQVWLRTLAGLEPIDVLHRRLEDDRLDPLEINAVGTQGVPALLLAVRAGGVTTANAHGSGLLEDPTLASCWDQAAEALTGTRPRLGLVTSNSGGVDDVIGAVAERVPRLDGEMLVEQPVVLRLQAIATDEGVAVVPGGSGRVLDDRDDPRIPTPCVSKDVRVIGPPDPPVVVTGPVHQVDLIGSVPTRAADSLYWLGRASERAEVLARTLRVALSRSQPPTDEVDAVLCGLISSVTTRSEAIDVHLPGAIEVARAELTEHIGSMLAEAASVREFLSVTTGRVLASMVDVRARLQHPHPAAEVAEEALLQLSAFAGLWNESVIRGPAWYYGDFARRYERAVTTLATVEFAVRSTEGHSPTATSEALEFVLSANDSLVAYRRRHRSDVEIGAVTALLVHDARNPRAVAASLRSLRVDAAEIAWAPGGAAIDRIEAALSVPLTAALVRDVIQQLHSLASSLTATRLVVPPDPSVLGPLGSTGGMG